MQIINHFSIPFKVFEGSTCLGTALPAEELCVPLDSYRWVQTHKQVCTSKHTSSYTLLCLLISLSLNHGLSLLLCTHSLSPTFHLFCPLRSELSIQPITEEDTDNQGEQFDCSEGFSYEDVSNLQPDTRLQQTCRRRGEHGGVLMVNIVPLKDAVTFKHTGDVGEHFDVPFVLHLWPSILLRNLLPYPIAYKLKVRPDW